MRTKRIGLICVAVILFFFRLTAQAQMTAFNYQGRLTDAGSPASGNYILRFRLVDAASSGTQVGATIADIPVTAAKSCANIWFEISSGKNAYLCVFVVLFAFFFPLKR